MLLLGDFEGLDSERAIAWGRLHRLIDRALEPFDAPDHVVDFVQIVQSRGLLRLMLELHLSDPRQVSVDILVTAWSSLHVIDTHEADRFHGGLAPLIARSRERAGRVKTAKRRSAAEGSLEAPKRSRTIECRSDVGRHYLQQLQKRSLTANLGARLREHEIVARMARLRRRRLMN